MKKFLLPVLAFFLAAQPALADSIIYESYIVNEPAKLEFDGLNPGEQFGAALSSGDFNADGFDDLVVGSPFHSTDTKEWNGAVRVMLSDGVQLREVLKVTGKNSGDQLGSSLSACDFNNDDIDDIIIGAYNSAYNDKRPGTVYVVYGQNVDKGRQDDFPLKEADITIIGDSDDDQFGLSLSTVDINNDNVCDLLIGAPQSKNSEDINSGAVYVFFGGKNQKASIDLSEDSADIKIMGTQQGERFGSSIAAGELTGDEHKDLAIGAYKASDNGLSESGRVYLYNGKKNWQSVIHESQNHIIGKTEKGWFGFDLKTGELNGDGIDDLAIGSFSFNAKTSNGRVSLYFGGLRFSYKGAIFEDDRPFLNTKIEGVEKGLVLGSTIIMDDFNKDEMDDLIIGSPGVGFPKSTKAGDFYTFFSKPIPLEDYYSIEAKNFSGVVHGENEDDWFGYSMVPLDYDNDGFMDLAVSSRYADNERGINNGKVVILKGRGRPFGELRHLSEPEDKVVTRGELVTRIVDSFEIKERKKDFLNNCYEHKDFCLFNFMAMSLYEGIQLDPLVLYPDVKPGDKYYDPIVTATLLGIVNGYTEEQDSPFYPEKPVSRIQALKVILSSIDAVKPMYKFELIREFGEEEAIKNQKTYFADVDPNVSHMWWYSRYVNFSVENNIISDGDYFRPDDSITNGELDQFISRTLEFLNKKDEETDSSGNS